MSLHLEHVYVSVSNLDRALAFYRRFFPDWVIRWQSEDKDRWVHFGPAEGAQPGYLSIAERANAEPFRPYEALGLQHVGFAHPDVDALVAHLKPELEPSDYVDDGRYRRAYYDDPDGVELEFVQKL